jgi:Na+/proline symporter
VLLAIFGYIFLQLLICFAVMRRMRSEQDYLLAGRSLGVPLAAMTIFATWFGAETCIGAAGSIYQYGLAGGRVDPFGYALCIFFMGLFFARRLWLRKLTTLGDFYRQRFGSNVEKLGVLLMVPPSVIWAAAQILAFGHVLSASSELTVDIAIAFAAAIVVAYTTLGGMLADVVSDFIQGIVLILGLLILLVVVFLNLPDPGVIAAGFAPERLVFRSEGETWLAVIDGWSIPLIGSLFAAELVARVLSCNSAEVARKAAMLGGTLYICVGLIPLSLGMIGPGLVPGLADPEQILPLLAQQYLPTALYVIFVGALVSAILSTVDSALLAAGSLVSHNLVLPLLPGTDERHKVRISRISVAIFGVVAYVLAINADSVLGLVEEASAFGSAGIFTCCLLGLTQKRGGPITAACSMVIGMVSYGVLAYIVQYDYAYLSSLACSLVTFGTLMWFEEPGLDESPQQAEVVY